MATFKKGDVVKPTMASFNRYGVGIVVADNDPLVMTVQFTNPLTREAIVRVVPKHQYVFVRSGNAAQKTVDNTTGVVTESGNPQGPANLPPIQP